MWPVSANWLAALGGSHTRYNRVEAWYAGAKVATIQVEGGTVQVTSRNRVRRQLQNLKVAESNWPALPTGTLAPYGAQIKAWQGILGTDGSLIGSEVPVFTGRIETVARVRRSGYVTVAALDPFADLNDAKFEFPRVAGVRTSVVGNIIGMITEVRPDADVVDLTGSTAVVPAGIVWDNDRGQAIDDLAASIGAEVFCQPDGVTWIIRPVPTITGLPVWTLKEGQGGTLVKDSQSMSRTGVPNSVIVHVEQPSQAPLVVPVRDTFPASLTHFGGPYGIVVEHYTNALIGSAGQAQAAGMARLARSIGATRTRDLDTVPNPALEGGDVISVVTSDGSTERHIADAFGVPLAVTDVMTINTRSTLNSVS